MTERRGPIVVGVDASRESRVALAFALDEAARCGDAVEMVTAWTVRPPAASEPVVLAGSLPASPDEMRERAEGSQEYALAEVAPGESRVTVSREVVEGEAGRVLVAASRHARLLVVGTRALGPFWAALLGSVSRYCAEHAECPVVVVPAQASDRAGQDEDAVVLAPRSSRP